MLIDGEFVESTSADYFEVKNPAIGEVVTTYPSATIEEVDVAVSAATHGFRIWSRTPTSRRAEILHRGAALVRQQAEELARTITQEMGKPLKDARSEVIGVAELFD